MHASYFWDVVCRLTSISLFWQLLPCAYFKYYRRPDNFHICAVDHREHAWQEGTITALTAAIIYCKDGNCSFFKCSCFVICFCCHSNCISKGYVFDTQHHTKCLFSLNSAAINDPICSLICIYLYSVLDLGFQFEVLLRSKTSSVLMRSSGLVRGSWVSGSPWSWRDSERNMKKTRIACRQRGKVTHKQSSSLESLNHNTICKNISQDISHPSVSNINCWFTVQDVMTESISNKMNQFANKEVNQISDGNTQSPIRYCQGEAAPHRPTGLRGVEQLTSAEGVNSHTSDFGCSSACVNLPYASSPHLHRGASSQSRCQSEGSLWVAAVPRRPSSGTPRSAVYSVTHTCTGRAAQVRGIYFCQEEKKTSECKWGHADRHAPVFILKHVQKNLLPLWLRAKGKSPTDHTVAMFMFI